MIVRVNFPHDGVTLVKTTTSEECSLVLVHRTDRTRVVAELIDGLSEKDVSLGSWARTRFAPDHFFRL